MDGLAAKGLGLRVLLAEDEILAALVLEDALSEEGHSVLLARDGEEALRLAETHGFDVLVTDLAMPRVTGWDLVPQLRASRPDLPVVVMTGYLPPGSEGKLFSGLQQQMRVLFKPFELDSLLRAIAEVTKPGRSSAGA
jgi:CheY-like chemotaxis protein